MALSYKKLSEEEDQMRNLIDAGEYQFSVAKIESTRTKNGKYEMLAVNLDVIDIHGAVRKLKDWIVFMDEMAWKLRHFAATCGLLDRYDEGLLEASDFLGKKGVVKIKIGDGEYNGEQVKVNSVVDYIKPGKEKVKPANDLMPADTFGDDIPF